LAKRTRTRNDQNINFLTLLLHHCSKVLTASSEIENNNKCVIIA